MRTWPTANTIVLGGNRWKLETEEVCSKSVYLVGSKSGQWLSRIAMIILLWPNNWRKYANERKSQEVSLRSLQNMNEVSHLFNCPCWNQMNGWKKMFLFRKLNDVLICILTINRRYRWFNFLHFEFKISKSIFPFCKIDA